MPSVATSGRAGDREVAARIHKVKHADGRAPSGGRLQNEGAPLTRRRRRVARRWGYSKCPIFLLEAAVPLLCLRLFGPFLSGQRLLVFVDNSTALFALRKGRSRLSPPLNEMCFSFWKSARSALLDVALVWVPTRFNVADDPSRGVPPVGCTPGSAPVANEIWERVFRPALRA